MPRRRFPPKQCILVFIGEEVAERGGMSMRAPRLILAYLLSSAVLLAVLALAMHFWPAAAAPDAVVASCLEALDTGDVAGALQWWAVTLPGYPPGDDAWIAERAGKQRVQVKELASLMPRAEVHVGPATYWSHCCEPIQLPDGYDAFAARVEVALQRESEAHQATFYLGDAAHDGMAWAWGLPWSRWWQRPRGRQRWRITGISL